MIEMNRKRGGIVEFPTQIIDAVCSRTDMVELVGDYVQLSEKGNEHWGRCPFHSEEMTSFAVSQDKGIYYCFSCRNGGNAINFAMEIEQLSFSDAVHFLAKRVVWKSRVKR